MGRSRLWGKRQLRPAQKGIGVCGSPVPTRLSLPSGGLYSSGLRRSSPQHWRMWGRGVGPGWTSRGPRDPPLGGGPLRATAGDGSELRRRGVVATPHGPRTRIRRATRVGVLGKGGVLRGKRRQHLRRRTGPLSSCYNHLQRRPQAHEAHGDSRPPSPSDSPDAGGRYHTIDGDVARRRAGDPIKTGPAS